MPEPSACESCGTSLVSGPGGDWFQTASGWDLLCLRCRRIRDQAAAGAAADVEVFRVAWPASTRAMIVVVAADGLNRRGASRVNTASLERPAIEDVGPIIDELRKLPLEFLERFGLSALVVMHPAVVMESDYWEHIHRGLQWVRTGIQPGQTYCRSGDYPADPGFLASPNIGRVYLAAL